MHGYRLAWNDEGSVLLRRHRTQYKSKLMNQYFCLPNMAAHLAQKPYGTGPRPHTTVHCAALNRISFKRIRLSIESKALERDSHQ